MKRTTLLLIMITGLFVSFAYADGEKEINKTFDAKDNLYVKAVSSNCDIEKGTENKIIVKVVYTYNDDCYKVLFNETGTSLEIEEDFSGFSCSGEGHISIKVPERIYVKFSSASGDFSLSGTKKGADINVASGDVVIADVAGEVDVNAASGDIKVKSLSGNLEMNAASGDLDVANVSGEVEAETASGDMTFKDITNGLDVSAASGNIEADNIAGAIEIKTASGDIKLDSFNGNVEIRAASGDIALENGKGAIEAKAASGNVTAEKIEITGTSDLGAASGSVSLVLSAPLNFDLELSSASGNSILDFNGNEIKGYVEMSAREDKGKIDSDVKFDKEEKEDRGGKTYDVKSFTKGGDMPKIYIKTSSGTAKLIK